MSDNLELIERVHAFLTDTEYDPIEMQVAADTLIRECEAALKPAKSRTKAKKAKKTAAANVADPLANEPAFQEPELSEAA